MPGLGHGSTRDECRILCGIVCLLRTAFGVYALQCFFLIVGFLLALLDALDFMWYCVNSTRCI